VSSRKSGKSKLLCGCKSHQFSCINCDGPTCPLELGRNNGCYCNRCYNIVAGDFGLPLKSLECHIPGCGNRTDQGTFRGRFCAPCYDYIVKGEGTHSQAYRNELVKANFRTLSAALHQAFTAYRKMGG